jgi:hypothetical protein
MTALLDEQNSSILVIIKFIIAAKGDRVIVHVPVKMCRRNPSLYNNFKQIDNR